MKTFNNLRDRLLLRLLSKTSRESIREISLYDIEAEIDHAVGAWGAKSHVGYAKCLVADLIDKPQWISKFNQANEDAANFSQENN